MLDLSDDGSNIVWTRHRPPSGGSCPLGMVELAPRTVPSRSTKIMTADQNSDNTTGEALLNEAEALIWSLLDDQIDDGGVDRLEKLLSEHEAIRRRYVECVQLHVDLSNHFQVPGQQPSGGNVLSSLISENLPGADGSHSPMSD